MTKEQALVDERGVRITRTVAQIRGKTYRLGEVSSVEIERRPASPALPLALGGAGALVLLVMLPVVVLGFDAALQSEPIGMCLFAGVASGLALLGGAGFAAYNSATRHAVLLDGREVLLTDDYSFADEVHQALLRVVAGG